MGQNKKPYEKYFSVIKNFIKINNNDRIITEYHIAREMIDNLPDWIWTDPDTIFFDPSVKSGIFLMLAALFILEKYEDENGNKKLINNDGSLNLEFEKEIKNVLRDRIFGVAIDNLTHLFSKSNLYYNKEASHLRAILGGTVFSIYDKDDYRFLNGNIYHNSELHKFGKDDKCEICGISKSKIYKSNGILDENANRHSNAFIHMTKDEVLEKIFHTTEEEMKKKKLIALYNPPYNLSTGGGGSLFKGGKPIYQKFYFNVEELKPIIHSAIIPAKFLSKNGNDEDISKFADDILTSEKIRSLKIFNNASGLFPIKDTTALAIFVKDTTKEIEKVKIQVYRKHENGLNSNKPEKNVLVFDSNNNPEISNLLENKIFNLQEISPIFIYGHSFSIFRKVINYYKNLEDKEFSFPEKNMQKFVSATNPYGIQSGNLFLSMVNKSKVNIDDIKILTTNKGNIEEYFISRNKISKESKPNESYTILQKVDKPKILVTKMLDYREGIKNGFFKSKVVNHVALSGAFLEIGIGKNEKELENILNYLKSWFVTNILCFTIFGTRNISQEKFYYIPVQDFSGNIKTSEEWDEYLNKKYDITDDEYNWEKNCLERNRKNLFITDNLEPEVLLEQDDTEEDDNNE
jgi:hypothetical protein